jgi:hypothetical protein
LIASEDSPGIGFDELESSAKQCRSISTKSSRVSSVSEPGSGPTGKPGRISSIAGTSLAETNGGPGLLAVTTDNQPEITEDIEMKINLQRGEVDIDTWAYFIYPGGGKHNGKLTVTNSVLCDEVRCQRQREC